MPFIHRASKSHRRRLVGSYDNLVLETGPIAYWPQDEASGSVAACLVNPAQNGAYTGVTLANDHTGPFGTPAPFYDGTNDYCNIQTAAFAAAFNGAEGSLMIWTKVNSAAVWTDGASREALYIQVDGNNFIHTRKDILNNIQRNRYRAGAATKTVAAAGTTADWILWLITWSASTGATGEMRVYESGVQSGATQTGLGVWAGAPTNSVIGAASTAPLNVYHGWLGPCAIWDRPLPPLTVEQLALV